MEFRKFFSLADDASVRDLKRAYAKKLKATSPESDPEGFQYLRTVYEYAQQAIQQEALLPASVMAPAIDDSEADENAECIEPATTEVVNDSADYQTHSDSNVDEIIRSLRNGLESQALAYLDMMRDNGEIFSLELSAQLEKKVIDFLLSLSESASWPTDFVSDFVRTLNLSEQAKSNAQIDYVLDVFYKRSTMAMNGWTSEQYEHDGWASDAVHKAMVDIRQCLFDSGQDAAIEVLDKYHKENFFEDEFVRYYLVKNYLTDIDTYFPGNFPYKLAMEFEEIFKFSVNFNRYSDDLKKSYNHYIERRKAAEIRNKQWQYFVENKEQVKGQAIGLLFDFIHIDSVRGNAIAVANELESLCSNLKKDDLYYFELGGDNYIEILNTWIDKVKARSVSAFKSRLSLQDRRLNPFAFIKDYRNITSDSGFITILSIVAACYGVTAFNVFGKYQNYAGVLNVTLIFAGVLMVPLLLYYFRCLYYSRWDSYVYREISIYKSSIRYKVLLALLVLSLLLYVVFGTYKIAVSASVITLIYLSRIIFNVRPSLPIFLCATVAWIVLVGMFAKRGLENPFFLALTLSWYVPVLTVAAFEKAHAAGWAKIMKSFLDSLFYILIAVLCVGAAGAFVLGALK